MCCVYLVLDAVEVDGEDDVRVRHRLHGTVHLHNSNRERESEQARQIDGHAPHSRKPRLRFGRSLRLNVC